MRPIGSFKEANDEGNILVQKQSLAAIHETWNMWEIQSLILLSLFMQVFLFLTAGLRRRSASLILRTVLWLAYLSADVVAIFVLGHLAVRATEPRHQLMSFWAPFVLVHLGGQDTITAFSKQDNELWMRHLLSMFTQVAVAGYVVARASWPDRLLRSAMVLMFISGCIKYAERTLCLFLWDPTRLRSTFLGNLSDTLRALCIKRDGEITASWNERPEEYMRHRLNLMSEGRRVDDWDGIVAALFVDDPPNTEQSILAADCLPDLLMEFRSSTCRYGAYVPVGANLVTQYNILYTKFMIRGLLLVFYEQLMPRSSDLDEVLSSVLAFIVTSPILLYPLLQYVSAPVAVVLFTVAEKGDRIHTSRADITVTYILLVGVIALDVCSATMRFLSIRVPSAPWRTKQWSEELGQYSMIKRHVVQGTTSMQQWVARRLGGWGVGLLELTRTPITEPMKELILDDLLLHGTRKEWHVASFRGLLSVQNWKGSRQHHPASANAAEALEKIISSVADFPTSVVIWHLATDICYYHNSGDSNYSDQQMNKDREVSRQLSNYIMYLVFKCGVCWSMALGPCVKAHEAYVLVYISPF